MGSVESAKSVRSGFYFGETARWPGSGLITLNPKPTGDPMRLPQAPHIKSCIHQFDPKSKIFLFGSRIDDTKHGGDIDLLVLSEYLQQVDAFKIKTKLYEQIGEQKIDIIISDGIKSPFVKLAFSNSVELT